MDAGTRTIGAVVALLVVAAGAAFVVAGPDLLGSSGPDLGEDEYPAGISSDGLEDGNETAAAHNETLRGDSYRLDLRAAKIVESGSGSDFQLRQSVRSDGNGHLRMEVDRSGVQSFQVSIWANRSVGLAKVTRGNQSAYQRMPPSNLRRTMTGSITIQEFLNSGAFETRNVSEENGRTLVYLTANEATDRASTIFQAQSIESFDGTVAVDTQGRVQYMDVTITYVNSGGSTITQTFHQELSNVGSTSVERPDWVSEVSTRGQVGLVTAGSRTAAV